MKLAEQTDHTIIEDNVFAEFPRRALRLSMAWIASSTSFVGGHFSAYLLFSVLKDVDYRKLIDGLRERLPHATGKTSARLKSIGIAPWIEPRAGIFLWGRLAEGLDPADIARRALASDIVVAPGNVFGRSQSACNFLGFNVSQCAEPRIFKMIAATIGK